MSTRLLGLCSTLALAGLTVLGAQQPTSSQSGTKRRIYDIPTPAVLGGLRTSPSERPDVPESATARADGWAFDAASGAEYRRGELLVRFRPGVDSTLQMRALQAARGSRIARVLAGRWNVVELESGASALESLAVLRRRSEVQEAALNYRLNKQQVRPNDEFFDLQWNFNAINMPAAWQINPGARNDVIVAVIDSGLNTVTDTFVYTDSLVGQVPARSAAVPDLVAEGRIVRPYDFVWDDTTPLDFDGHGTHVAGTVGQQTNNNLGLAGIAYNVQLMPVKVLGSSWDALFAPNLAGTSSMAAEAIRYAADNGAKVINLSLGTTAESPILRDAISYAVSSGAFVSIAAGNSGDEGNPTEYPAAYASQINGAMTVGATNRDRQHAEYSGFHPYVEICAPGGDQFTLERGVTQISYDDDATLSLLTPGQLVTVLRAGVRPRFDAFAGVPSVGTSMAAPHVSGVAALLYSQGITNPAAIEQAIKRFAQPIDATSNQCGSGLVDARRALRGFGLAR
jgi:serine protease